MNKPDWKDAPEWANWLAQDADDRWFWFELEPTPGEEYLTWVLTRQCGRFTHAGGESRGLGPKEPRPKPKVETIQICSSDRVSIIIGGCVRNFVDGPCTITITEP